MARAAGLEVTLRFIGRCATWVVGLCSAVGLAGCGDAQPPIDQVGVNVVEKALFEGSWYMARTVIDVDYEGSALGTFPGDAASDAAQDFTAMPRIRFVIDEKYLFAYRDYEIVAGGDGDVKGPKEPSKRDDGLGQPVAAFAIEKHFDVRRAYNPSTGEEQNVVVENDTDKKWYERQFMRVDWSKNLLPGFYGQTYNLNELAGMWKREPTDLYVQNASVFPDSWQPRFDRMGCDGSATTADNTDKNCSPDERDFADDYKKDQLYHMSFVTQETLSPGTVTDSAGNSEAWCAATRYSDAPACTSVVSYVRTSFLRVSDKRQYEPVNWVDSRFDRFGYFRLSQSVDDRSTGKPDDPAYFFTDFLNYNINRHNLWKQWFDKSGKPLPYDKRDVRQIVWYTTPELPAHLVQSSFDVVGQWNETFMETVRRLRGEALPTYPEVDCQTDEPDGYCYCQEDPASGEVVRPTCAGQYDPFKPPEAYGAGVQDAYDCWVELPKAAEPNRDDPKLNDADFNGWFDAKFVGSECATVLRINTCNRASIAENKGTAEGLLCQERGDLRYKFLSYVDQPGTGFLGIATLRGDPVSGEIITGDANIGGPALDSFRTSALLTYDLTNGRISEKDLIAGEDVRSYFENLGHVDQPARPRTDFSAAIENRTSLSAATQGEIDNRMQSAMKRLSRLQGPEGRSNIYSDRMQKMVGSDLERRLSAGLVELAGSPASATFGAPELTESLLDQISPFRTNAVNQFDEARKSADKLSRANVEMPNEYVDASVQNFVNKHLDWPRARLEFALNRLLFRQTVLHELGHCFGLRHDFGASADLDNYTPDYFAIVKRLPLPDPADYDADGKPGLSVDEQAGFDRDVTEVRKQRELLGIDGAMSSSVMEYTSNWYERVQPLGSYDHAAIAYGYGDLIEAYAGPKDSSTPRETFANYVGGEICETDADCPYSVSGTRSTMLLDSNGAADLTQRCVQNPRTAGAKLCSNFDSDVAVQAKDGGDYQPLQYRFCTDERAGTTLAWCNRFDEGASYREIVRNVAEDYERSYPFAAFRRYRKDFSVQGYTSGLVSRRFSVLQNIYQNLLYEYTSNPAFRDQKGPLGFYDEFLASTDILNFYGKVLAEPNVGGYVFDERSNSYVRGFIEPGATAADLPIPIGLGRYFNSDYQAGLSGIERVERVGSFYDKVIVLQLLTQRGVQSDYTPDVAFYANYYDLFPNEMQQIFGGMIRGFPEAIMPRVRCASGAGATCKDPRIVYMDFYRGDCSKPETCRPNPAEVTYAGLPLLDGGSSLSLQIYAAIYALQEFPVYFDASFQNQLFLCIEGQGDCIVPDAAAVDGVDYVRYTSDRYHRSFVAFQVEPKDGVAEQTSIGFAMVKEASEQNAVLGVLLRLRDTTPPYTASQLSAADIALLKSLNYDIPATSMLVETEITRIDARVVDLESFFNQIIELERENGIVSFGYWP